MRSCNTYVAVVVQDINVEISGVTGNDIIIGTDRDDMIDRGGNDTIFGQGRNDVIEGHPGADRMYQGDCDETQWQLWQ